MIKTRYLLWILITLLAVCGVWFAFGLPASTFAAGPPAAVQRLMSNDVIDMGLDEQGQIWVASSGGIMSRFDGKTWLAYSLVGLVDNAITALTFDKNGHLWVGTKRGISEFDGQTWKDHTSEGSPGYRQINTMTVDEAGTIWVGAENEFYLSKHGIEVRRDDQVLWAKPSGGDWITYTTKTGLGSRPVSVLAVDQAAHVWIDTGSGWYHGGGASRFDGKRWITYTTQSDLVHPYVTAIAPDRQGTTWIGTVDGVSAFDGHTWKTYTTTAGLAYPWVTAIVVDPTGGKVWFGTWGGGVSRFDGQNWTTYTAADGLASNVIYTLAFDPAGQLWVGTNGGLSKFDGKVWATYTTRDGLPDNHIRAIAAGSLGHLWIGTDQGLSDVETAGWFPSQPDNSTVRAMPVTATSPISWEVIGPRLVDERRSRSYAQGKVGGQEKTLVLDSIGGKLSATYDLAGPLALDRKNGWLYVDQGAAGLTVVDIHTQQLHQVIMLPESTYTNSSPPQIDLETGRALAFRDNVVYIIDPAGGDIVDTLPTGPINQEHCSSGLVNTSPQPIHLAAYDQANRILYLDFNDRICTSTSGGNTAFVILSYNMATKTEIARGRGAITSGGAIIGGDFYLSSYSCISAFCQGYRSVWRQGRPWMITEGWRDGGSPLAWDPTRRLFYEVTNSSLRVFDGATMGLTIHLPRPLTGTFEGYDSTGDQLLFRQEGGLESWPAGAIQPPAPEPLTTSSTPTTPVRFLAASPNWTTDQTLFGLWDDPTGSQFGEPMYHCFVGNQRGSLLNVSQDGGQTWEQPLGGLRGSCERFTALAISPDYTHDHTLLAGVFGLGIFKSTDGGQLWQPSGIGLTQMNISKIVLSPDFTRDSTAFAQGAGGEFYRSTDGGRSWKILDKPVQQQDFYPDFALSPDFDGGYALMVWSHTYNSATQTSDSQLYISRDGGDTWDYTGDLPGDKISLIGIAPLFARWQTLLAYGRQSLYRSTDGGRSWSLVFTPDQAVIQIVFAPDVEQNRPVFALTRDKIYHSTDGGQTWTGFALPAGVTPTALALSPDFSRDGLLFVGTTDGRILTIGGDK